MTKDCPAEASKQSEHSPSKVGNSETLLYVLIEPHNYEANGISARAFSRTELKNSQVSISRKNHIPRDILQKEVIDILLEKDQRRKFMGVLQAKCLKIRQLKTEEPKSRRAFCVIDDGTLKNVGHTHLGFSHTARQQTKSQWTAYRENLTLLFGEECSINEIYT